MNWQVLTKLYSTSSSLSAFCSSSPVVLYCLLINFLVVNLDLLLLNPQIELFDPVSYKFVWFLMFILELLAFRDFLCVVFRLFFDVVFDSVFLGSEERLSESSLEEFLGGRFSFP